MSEHNTPTIKILVGTHKAYRMPSDPMYLPIRLGAALHKDSDPVLRGYQRDDTGDNISSKNPLYCELTGLYWAWKNLDADYIGLVHYRRHFGSRRRERRCAEDPFDRVILSDEILPLLPEKKVFVPAKRHYVIETLMSHYEHTHYGIHLMETRRILASLCPEYLPTFDRVLGQRSGHMFNMMIMERTLLDQYCSWLFHILGELEHRVDTQGLSYFQARYCGRVGEIIFNVWLAYQMETGAIRRDEVVTLPFVMMEKVDYPKKIFGFLEAKFLHRKYEH